MCAVVLGYVAAPAPPRRRAAPPFASPDQRPSGDHDDEPSPAASRVAFAALLAVAGSGASAQNWKPTRPINLIVPWAAGGSTDQITRVTAAELEKALGQTIVIVNQPGASGSIGTKSALDAAKDGYTWTAGAAQDLGTYQTLGSLNAGIKDWNLFLTVANIQVIGVNPATPYQNAKQLLDAMKAKPGKISVATAGVTSAGHNAMELIAKATGVNYRHVTYDGGNPAVVATVAGEAEVTTQLAVEQADMIRGKRLRPLATVSDKPLELEGYGTIPPLSDTLPGFTAPANYFGIFMPKGVPDEVVKTLEKIWAENIAKSEAIKKYADQPRRAVRAVVRRGGAEGGVPGGAGQRLAALRRRQGQGLARHRRHPEALSDLARADAMSMTAATSPTPTSRPARRRARSPRSDLRGGHRLDACSASPCSSARSRWTGSSAQDINPYTVPGLLPGLLGIVIDPARRAARRCAAGGAAARVARRRARCTRRGARARGSRWWSR